MTCEPFGNMAQTVAEILQPVSDYRHNRRIQTIKTRCRAMRLPELTARFNAALERIESNEKITNVIN